MARLLRDRYLWYIVTLAALLVGFVYAADFFFPSFLRPIEEQHLVYMALQRILFLITVAIAVWRFGTKGGLAAYLTIALVVLPYTIMAATDPWRPYLLLEIGIVASVGLIAIWLIGTSKRAAEELTRLASFPELNPDPVIEVDLNGVATYLNPAARKGFPELLTAGEKHPILISLKSALADLKSKKQESLSIEVKVGNRIYEQRGSYVPESERLRSYIRDITERKKMQEKLIMTDRLASIGELSAGVAHELNNPLTGVIGFSELLLEKDVPDDIREDIAIIHHEAKRVAEVVKNLLTFASKHTASKQLVDINTVIAGVLGLRAYEQKVGNIQVVTHLAPDLPEVMADRFQLQQVFFNIITNAEYFMTEVHNKGTLTITTKRVGDVIRASFADDGPGISREDLGHLFDPFFTTKEVGKGTGLGLSICHGMITEHGGRIYAESELGKGATFIVELPVVNHQ